MPHLRHIAALLTLALPLTALAQATQPTTGPATAPGRARGGARGGRGGGSPLSGVYGPQRSNNDLLSYHLDIRINPTARTVGGKNTITFKMLKDDTAIHIDLVPSFNVDKILLADKTLEYTREGRAVLIKFPDTLKPGQTYSIDFHYSGTPTGGMTFGTTPAGGPWIYTSNEGPGSSTWWPSKDHWHDEPENMKMSIAVPTGLTDASNGKLLGKTDLPDGYTRFDWQIHYPINNYCVSVNIADYAHFSDVYKPKDTKLPDLALDYYVLPANLEQAKTQWQQAKGMMDAFYHYFGEYPFVKDGYKLVHVPYAGMEHQSAVTYGNQFSNGYNRRDWTGVGISMKFDFIIIHESGHEWFGNAVSAADRSDMWIHEGWCTYLEMLYVEHHWGTADALTYINGYRNKVQNRVPIVGARNANTSPPQDMYFKGALFINMLRTVVDDDKKWFTLLKDFYDAHKYKSNMTEDVVAFFNKGIGQDLTPVFDQYLRRTALPTFIASYDQATKTLTYQWQADEAGFNLPVKIGTAEKPLLLKPTTQPQKMTLAEPLTKEQLTPDPKRYYILNQITP